jgi:nucleoside 2-deoxyribosyltransferase
MQMATAIAITKQCALSFRVAAKTRAAWLLFAAREEKSTRFFHLAPSRGRMPPRENKMTKLYLAGPLFSFAEQGFNVELARFLESQGFEVWLPQEHEPRSKTARAIFDMDVAAIEEADMVVACMDGPDPDSGTAWECGYAFAKGKPIVCYRTDFRLSGDTEGAPYNLMLTESATARFEIPFRTKREDFQRRLLEHISQALAAKLPTEERA